MLETLRVLLPSLQIAIVRVAAVLVTTFANARLPLTLMIRVGATTPVPDALFALPPLVASPLTVTVPL